MRTFQLLLGGAFALGCAAPVRARFEATDPTFRAMAGPRPRVYVDSNLDGMSATGLRSVGLITVRVPRSSGIQRVLELAADKGQELGCWIVVEHDAFSRLPRATLGDRVEIHLAHGPGPHVKSSIDVRVLEGRFDCVVRSAPHDTPPRASWRERLRLPDDRARQHDRNPFVGRPLLWVRVAGAVRGSVTRSMIGTRSGAVTFVTRARARPMTHRGMIRPCAARAHRVRGSRASRTGRANGATRPDLAARVRLLLASHRREREHRDHDHQALLHRSLRRYGRPDANRRRSAHEKSL